MPEEKLPALDLDFGAPAAPAADDPLAALAAELAVELESDVVRQRERETARQVELLRERGPQLETAAPAAAELEVSLRASTLDLTPEGDISVTRRVIRTELRGGSPLRRALRTISGMLAPVFSLGTDSEKLPRVARGLLARGALLVASAGFVATLLAGAPGSAYDVTYAPDAARVRFTGGLAPVLDGGDVPNATGIVDEAAAVGLTIRLRAFLDVFDAAAASGDTTALARLFADPAAASGWIAAAERLHESGAVRSYPFTDPRTATPLFFAEPGGIVTLAVGGPMIITDTLPSGETAKRIEAAELRFRFRSSGGSWELLEVVLTV